MLQSAQGENILECFCEWRLNSYLIFTNISDNIING